MVTVNRDGFTLLSGGEDARSGDFSLNIIFIHGLRGHPRKTWTGPRAREGDKYDDPIRQRKDLKSFWGLRKTRIKSIEPTEPKSFPSTEIFWPEEYLVPEIPEARIWSYGYNADVMGGFFQANNKNSVSQHGRDLAVRLEREIENEDSIVFVAHSLGGIIVKDALHKSRKCRGNTKFIVFLGTPHRGSKYADWGKIVSKIAQLALHDPNERILAALEVNNEVLDNIHEEFKNIVVECGIKMHSFQEAHGISGIKGLNSKAVDDFSSKLDLPSGLETVESIDANHMEMARCRSRDDARYRAIAGVLRQFVRKEHLKTKLAAKEPVLSKPFLVPFSRDDFFIGREDILATISVTNKQALAPRHRRAALVGLGGVGKSQIAIEYIYRSRERMPEITIFWIHASSSTRFKQEYRDLAEQIKIPRRDDPHVNILQLVCRWLSDDANGPWLMVLDNVDDDEVFFSLENSLVEVTHQSKDVSQQQALESFIPQSSNGSVLVTSRSSTAARNLVGDFGDIVTVEPMTDSEALGLLKSKIPVSESFLEDAEALVQELEGIPLAITHAAAYIRNRQRVTISVYLQLFRESKANQATLLSYNDAKDLRRDYSTRHPTLFTWQITFEQIRKTTPVATDLLALMSMFDWQAIPEHLLHESTDQLQFEDAIAPLLCFSLIRQQAEGDLFDMHRLVQLSTRNWLESNQTLQRWVSEALRTVAEAFPKGGGETWPRCQTLVSHSREVLTFETEDKDDIINRAEISAKLGHYLSIRFDFAPGELLIRDALKAIEKRLGSEHSSTVELVSQLALVLQGQGKCLEAEALSRRAMETSEKLWGSEDLRSVGKVYMLALLLKRQGRYHEAEPLNRRAADGFKKLCGPEAPLTLESISHLAAILISQRNFTEAESLSRCVLTKFENVLGSDHPNTLSMIIGLAIISEEQGKHEESESLFRRTLEGQKKTFGSNHMNSLADLASLLRGKKKYDGAELLSREMVKRAEKGFGSDYLFTLTKIGDLATILSEKGMYDEAESLYRQTLKKKEILGSEHPFILKTMNNLGGVLGKQMKYDEAESLFRRTLELARKVLGPEHRSTLTNMGNLAWIWQKQGKNADAIELMKQCVALQSRTLGEDDPDTIFNSNVLSYWERLQGTVDDPVLMKSRKED